MFVEDAKSECFAIVIAANVGVSLGKQSNMPISLFSKVSYKIEYFYTSNTENSPPFSSSISFVFPFLFIWILYLSIAMIFSGFFSHESISFCIL